MTAPRKTNVARFKLDIGRPGTRLTLLLLLGLVAGMAGWIILRDRNEPRYQGKTAKEWFNLADNDLESRQGYRAALKVLGTNFIPVLIRTKGDAPSRFRARFDESVRKLPKPLRRLFPPHVSKFPRAKEGMAFLGEIQSPEVLSVLRKSMRETHPHHQYGMQHLLLCYRTKATLPGSMHLFVHDEEFPVRFFACIFSAQAILAGHTNVRSKEDLIPVFAEALTNSSIMQESFGVGAKYWRQKALEHLEQLSPEPVRKLQTKRAY
jgi:hypothetical protein